MTKEKIIVYKKAYAELYEFIKALTIQEQQKIPLVFIENLRSNLDKNYVFRIDIRKDIMKQNYMIETKALIVELYKKYLAPHEEAEFWKQYDYECWKINEKEKAKRYNPNDMFKNKKENKEKEVSLVQVKIEKWYEKLFLFFKNLFRK